MKAKQKRKNTPAAPPVQPYRLWLWLVFFASSLFFIPQCLDRYLAPRFLFASLVLLAGMWSLRKLWVGRENWSFGGFGLLLLAWYGWNVASVSWAFSWSEGVFYAQKVLLFVVVFGFAYQAWQQDEVHFRQTMARIVQALTLVVSVLLVIQLVLAMSKHGLDNQILYDYASGIFGNKNLASGFLFFLLILNGLFYREFKKQNLFWISLGVLFLLILVLQTRAVYLATVAAGLFYFGLRFLAEPDFRPFFLKKILPAGLLGLLLLASLIAWKGRGSSLAERLNPATYLESASALERRFVWYKTDVLNKEHPWLGVGNGSWKILFPSKSIEGAFRLQERNIVMTRAHNDYLEIQAEMGLVGVSLFILLFVVVFAAGLMTLFRSDDQRKRQELVTLLSGLAGYCVIQYFDFPRERIEFQIWLAFLFAALAYHSREVLTRGPVVSVGRYKNAALGLVMLGLLFNGWIGLQRIKGEMHTVRALEAQSRGDYPALQREAAAASNDFYKYNDVALPLAWYEGIAFYQMNQVPQAVAAFEEAYRLNPWAFQVLNNYASSLVRAQRFQEAVGLFEKALEINPKYDEGKLNLAYCWLAMGDTDVATQWLNRVDTIPNPQTIEEQKKNQAVLQQKAGLEAAIIKQQNLGQGQ